MEIVINSEDFSLVLNVDSNKRLRHVYFGKKLKNEKEISQIVDQLGYNHPHDNLWNHAYTPSGTWNLAEPAFQVAHADGNISSELEYVTYKTKKVKANVYLTVIVLKDPIYKTEVELHYQVFQKQNVYEQWTTIKNQSKDLVLLKKYASTNLYFRNKEFHLTQFHGTWATEMQPKTQKLTPGIKTLDTKLTTRAHMYSPPTFMLSFDRAASEDEGKVILANLAWSGNYRFDFEVDPHGNLRLIAGANNYAAEYQLQVGQEMETPHFIFCYSENGKTEASLNMHDWARKYRIYDGDGDRMTLLNNWEATYFDFDQEKIVDLFDDAKKIGVDLFLLDDGWFATKYPRNDDTTALGDWHVNDAKLPNGIDYLTQKAKKKGIKFGIWIEPEMVNPKSELYENHLDWVIRQPDRKEYYYRNQLVLDLCNLEVQDHVFKVFDDLFIQSPEIAYVKWDCNSTIYNAHSSYLEKLNLPQSHLYFEYVKGLYKVLERVRKKYPKKMIMLCSGGGSRVDYKALSYFNEFWISDNTAPIDRVFMHWNYSYFYPANTLAAHVTDWDKTASIKFRVDVASMGRLGFDIIIAALDEKDQKFCKKAVKNYNGFKPVILHGDCYRLQSPYKYSFACMQFVDKKKSHSVVFSYLITNRFKMYHSIEPVLLKGLDAKKKYKVKELNLHTGEKSPLNQRAIFSGDFLMKVGYNPKVTETRRSVVLEIKAIK